MIYGETTKEYIDRIESWRQKFAIFPRRMSNGQKVWMGWYSERRIYDAEMPVGFRWSTERVAVLESPARETPADSDPAPE